MVVKDSGYTRNSNHQNKNLTNLSGYLNDKIKKIPSSKAKSNDVIKIAQQLTFLTNKNKPELDSNHILLSLKLR